MRGHGTQLRQYSVHLSEICALCCQKGELAGILWSVLLVILFFFSSHSFFFTSYFNSS